MGMLKINMNKYKCVLSYDGTNFSGFQIQPEQRTIQGEIEKALMVIHKGEPTPIYGAGRTDAGVHAKAQTFHFESPFNIPAQNWKKALNNMIPDDLYIQSVQRVPATFHAQFDALEREYRYFVRREPERDVFNRLYAYHFPYPLDMNAILEACEYLQGEHDFTTFSSAKSTVKGSKVRHLSVVRCIDRGSELEFIFRANGFLYQMVRILVGTLLEVGQGRIKAADIPEMFAKKDRTLAGHTAPPHGLFLWEVSYPNTVISQENP